MYRRSIFTLAAALALAAPLSVNAEPITIAGVNWGLSQSERDSLVAQKGLTCAEPKLEVDEIRNEMIFDQVKCSKDLVLAPDQEQQREYLRNDTYIGFSAQQIRFGCALFNACDASLDGVAQRLVDDGRIKRLSKELIRVPKRKALTFQYCGNGDDGDRLCVVPNDDNKFQTLIIEKGTFGKATSFD